MTKTLTSPYDVADHLKDDEMIQYFLEEAFETGEPAFIAKALGAVARARNMTQLAELTGMSRTSLYKALSGDVSPELGTILKVARALGYRITVEPDRKVDDAA